MENKEKQSDLMYVKHSSLDRYPIRENLNKVSGYIEWSGGISRRNLFPLYIKDLYNKCSLHNSIIQKKVDFMCSGGFDRGGISPQLDIFYRNVLNESMDIILQKISGDLVLMSGFALLITWDEEHTRIEEVSYIDIATLRIIPPCEEYEYVRYEYCEGWESETKYKKIRYPNFSKWRKDKHQIFWCVEHSIGSNSNWYPIPEYSAAFDYLETDKLIAQSDYNSVYKGFSGQVRINIIDPSNDKEAFEEQCWNIKEQMSNPSGQGILITRSRNGDDKMTFDALDNGNNSDRYLNLKGSVENAIYNAHNIINRQLFGGKSDGGFSKPNVSESADIFNDTYILKKQKFICDHINILVKANGISDNPKINRYNPVNSSNTLTSSDIMNICRSVELSEEQKYEIFITYGMDASTATILSGKQ